MKITTFTTILVIIIIPQLSIAQIPRNQSITAAEYFINTDPGEGQAIAIPGTYGTWEVTVNVSNIIVPIGSKLYVRFKSSNGKWSAPRAIKRNNYFSNSGAIIVQGEYFINNDPGYGNGTQLSFSNGVANINNSNLHIKRGDKVYVRVRDNFNRWSPSRPMKFNFKDIDSAVYYVKHLNGTTTPLSLMSISSVNDSSNIFTSKKTNFSWTANDTAFVRFQTKDKFYSKWIKTGTISSIQGINVNLKLAIEGLFNQSTNLLNRKDTVKILLRRASNPFQIRDSAIGIIDSVSLTESFTFPNAVNGNYYLVVKHHNSLETWSKSGGIILFTGTSTTYDFTTAITQAYGSNMVLKGGKYCNYSGDVNQDGTIDGIDLSFIDNDAFNFKLGYKLSDLTGDNFVDGNDFGIGDNNASNFITIIRP